MWKWEVCNQGNNDVPGEYLSAQISCHHPKLICTLSITIPALFPSFMKQDLTSQDHILGRTCKERGQLNITRYRCVKMLLQLCARHIETMTCLQMSHLGVNTPGWEWLTHSLPVTSWSVKPDKGSQQWVRHILRWSEADWMCHRAAHQVSNLGQKRTHLAMHHYPPLGILPSYCPSSLVQLCESFLIWVRKMHSVRWCR